MLISAVDLADVYVVSNVQFTVNEILLTSCFNRAIRSRRKLLECLLGLAQVVLRRIRVKYITDL